MDGKDDRTADWLVKIMTPLLRDIIARRADSKVCDIAPAEVDHSQCRALENQLHSAEEFLDEVKEIIFLPEFSQSKSITPNDNGEPPHVASEVESELRLFVVEVASLYQPNPFHNFDHATHVCLAVVKLMSRIVAPLNTEGDAQEVGTKELHDHTYGITSDPLTQFTCVLAALIHDLDHPGVGNPRLAVENPEMGKRFKNRSIAEQNSLAVAWKILMKSEYKNLRAAIYQTPDEMRRFRALLVNAVMATDIMDEGLKQLRNGRWDRAFDALEAEKSSDTASRNRKATIVIEHLMQAADVAHTMSHVSRPFI